MMVTKDPPPPLAEGDGHGDDGEGAEGEGHHPHHQPARPQIHTAATALEATHPGHSLSLKTLTFNIHNLWHKQTKLGGSNDSRSR